MGVEMMDGFVEFRRVAAEATPGARLIADPVQFLINNGFLAQMNAAMFHPLGYNFLLNENGTISIEDCGDNPVNVIEPEEYRAKVLVRYVQMGAERYALVKEKRVERLGFYVQNKDNSKFIKL